MSEITLNFEQKKAVDLVMSGHNVFVGGRAGTGKTFTAKYLVKLSKRQKKVFITCTTGMACTLYEQSTTLHSFAGLKNSRLDLDALVLSVTSDDKCLERWRSADLLVIDELSQCSMKVFETINVLAQKARRNTFVFGGLQVVGVGDFYQLPPVRSDIDEAKYCFESSLWREVFPHTVLLQTVYRQENTERQFLKMLGEFADGVCSPETLSIIKNQLSRKKLNEKDFGMEFIPHIFCNNFDANFYNMEELDKLPGEMKVYKADDTLSDSILRKVTVAQETLALKRGAEVMLLYNISDKLKNGTRGRIVDLSDDGPTVNFYHIGLQMKVPVTTWFAYIPGTNQILGYRKQFPLKLAYGITAHKSQGQTMKAACVHSGKEFVPGQLYVACSRVSSMQGLSIVNFNEYKLIRSSSKVENFYANCHDDAPLPSLMCCTHKALCLDGINGQLIEMEQCTDDFQLDDQELEEIDKICNSYFSDDQSEQQNRINLDTVLNDIISQMSNDLPKLNEVSPNALLDQLKEMVKNTSTTLTAKILDVIDFLEHKDHLPNLKAFASIQQNRLYKVLQEKSKKKKKDTTAKFDFKMLLSFEFSIFSRGDAMKEFASMMCIPEKELAVEHFWVMTELIKVVRSDIIGQMYNLKFESEAASTQKKNVWDMSKEGQGKVRYVGGWAIIKLIYSFKKYITTNCTSCNARVRQEMRKRCKWIDMLESLLLQSANVHESSSYKETLTVIDVRQFRNNALVYINDKAFEFFMGLEQKRTNTLCHENLNALKGSMLSLGLDSAKCDSQLKEKWNKLFACDDGNQQDAADILYLKIVDKYFSMGAGQYIRDFRRDYNVTKTEAHRKRVQEKKIVKERRNEKVAIASIKDDTSINRQDSHNQLLAMVTKSTDIFETTYTKKEIELLFQAYGLKYCNSWTKTRLNPVLVDAIKAATQFICPELLLSHERKWHIDAFCGVVIVSSYTGESDPGSLTHRPPNYCFRDSKERLRMLLL